MNHARIVFSMILVTACLCVAAPVAAQKESSASVEAGSTLSSVGQGDFVQRTYTLEEVSDSQMASAMDSLGCVRATYIFDHDGQTLLRVEYYDANDRLAYYSEVKDYNVEWKSYTEMIYVYDSSTQTQTLLRTDTYAGGQMTESVAHTAEESAKPTARPASQQESKKSDDAYVPAAPAAPSVTAAPAAPAAPKEESAPAAPAAPKEESVPAAPAAPKEESVPAAPAAPKEESAPVREKDYDHTTSIYSNDEKTLLRVEYYNSDNKLTHYSEVVNYDNDTKSYTENIYVYDNETETQILQRTDTYVNGELESSEKPQ